MMNKRVVCCVVSIIVCFTLSSCGIPSKIERAIVKEDFETVTKIYNEKKDDEKAMHTLASIVEMYLQDYSSGAKTVDEVGQLTTVYYDAGDIDHTESAIKACEKAIAEEEFAYAQLLSAACGPTLDDTINKLRSDAISQFAAGEIDYDAASKIVNNCPFTTNMYEYSTRLSKMKDSKTAFADGEAALLTKEYVSAVQSFLSVSEEDSENYQKAHEKIKDAKKSIWVDEQATINDLLPQGKYQEAWDSMDNYIQDVQRMDADADNIYSIDWFFSRKKERERFSEEMQFLISSVESHILDSIDEMKEQGDYWGIYSLLNSVPKSMISENVVSVRHEISAEWLPTIFSVKNISCKSGYLNSLYIYADFKNLSEKELKYVNLYFEGYDDVGEREYDYYGVISSLSVYSGDSRDAEYIHCLAKGPFKQGEGHTKAQGHWYKSMCFATRLELAKVKLEYMDGTTITISDKAELAYFQGT